MFIGSFQFHLKHYEISPLFPRLCTNFQIYWFKYPDYYLLCFEGQFILRGYIFIILCININVGINPEDKREGEWPLGLFWPRLQPLSLQGFYSFPTKKRTKKMLASYFFRTVGLYGIKSQLQVFIILKKDVLFLYILFNLLLKRIYSYIKRFRM